MDARYQLKSYPVANKDNIIQGENYRITVLTSGLIRLEYAKDNSFEDRGTQMVLNRDFESVNYKKHIKGDWMTITTDRLTIQYDMKDFSANGLSIKVLGALYPYGNVWHYGMKKNHIEIELLKGTARTLDNTNGKTELEDGLISQFGFSVIDDSKSLILKEDGWVEPRKQSTIDIYFFGYGHDYQECLNDFYYLSGKTPMVPRYALGNWWSRYYKYTQESYQALIERFEREKIPFSVAVIDMDWHLVDIDTKYGSGWTGYTWNKELFPQPNKFLEWLHDHDLAVTLNVHPAEGIRGYEDKYETMALKLGKDVNEEEPIEFDISSEVFAKSYFEDLHHPLEDEGVDFWWIDWQQGGNTKIEGLDPLWMLNHYHYLDNSRGGKRPMTFSRYSGPGSHRYPIGFSGDTITTWESLDFQPYFTASASNIGYNMWSHDIGGHMLGYKDDELSGRWLQYGVFSPIMRLHSCNSIFNGKEPWNYRPDIYEMMKRFLQLRHELIPYMYTMLYRQYKENKSMILPMYFDYPMEGQSYELRNQYLFGSELLVSPITKPTIDWLHLGKVNVWLPEGQWIDFFTGKIYDGNQKMEMYRDMSSIPVFIKSGGIIPLMSSEQSVSVNPEKISLIINPLDSGSFELYEDDNTSNMYLDNDCIKTKFYWNKDENEFKIEEPIGNKDLIPKTRTFEITFIGIENTKVMILDNTIEYNVIYKENKLILILKDVKVDSLIVIKLESVNEKSIDFLSASTKILKTACMNYLDKEKIYGILRMDTSVISKIKQLHGLNLNHDLIGSIIEQIN